MSFYVPKRSIGGCLTCKQRKKKCDETKPVCQRCINGDFRCLGYGQQGALNCSSPNGDNEIWNGTISTYLTLPTQVANPYLVIQDNLISLPEHTDVVGEAPRHATTPQKTTSPFASIPRNPQIRLDSSILNQTISLILSQYSKLTRHIIFKPPALPIQDGIRRRANDSEIALWSMYLGAKIIEDISNGNTGQRYMGWITRFNQKVTESCSATELDLADLEARFSTFHHLATWAYAISGTSTGYSLFRRYTPMFLRYAALLPELWSENSTISVSAALQIRKGHYSIKNFVLHDTVVALALGVPPLIHYDTSALWAEEGQAKHLEWVYGFPAGIIVLLAKITAWRVSRMMGQFPNRNEWFEIEGRLQSWSSTVDHTDEASDDIARLAVQEAWRQATLLYLYMGMCEVNSADPRVESCVRQIVQLANSIGAGTPLEMHIFIPCLIAAAAARQEKHRATLRSKIAIFRNLSSLMLRGADFVTVLDHLWHGTASGGRPITWEDYVQSRCAALPIPFEHHGC